MLLITAATTSVLSTLAFIAYLVLPVFSGQSRAHYTVLYGIGIAGLAIAEACQILGVITLIAEWLSGKNVEKKPKELVVLLLSLIPYVVVVIFLITLVVYLRSRQKDPASERTREAAQELKEQAVDTIIGAGAQGSESIAGPPTHTGRPSAARPSTRPSMRDAVSQVVGPSTGRSVSDAGSGLVAFTVAALLVSAVAILGVVVPANGLAPVQPLATSTSLPISLAGTWNHVTFSNCTDTGALAGVCQGVNVAGLSGLSGTMSIQQSSNALTLTVPTSSSSLPFTGTLVGRAFTTTYIEHAVGTAAQCVIHMNGSVLDSSHLSGTFTESCTGTIQGTVQAHWTATRVTP